jgi:serine/threonine-protein kinase
VCRRLDPESGATIAYLAANHTASARFQITFDFNILFADGSTPHRDFTPTGDFFDPECDPAPVPVPVVGRLEGESGYACASDGDCHLTVVDNSTCRLHELWRADLAGDTVDHALRFILPSPLIRADICVRPGTHSTSTTGGGSAAPPYAARLRLKASKDISGLGAGAQVIARALKRYGMFLADGGNVTFTAATGALTTHKWSEVGVASGSLKGLSWNDFEVVALGTRLDHGAGSCSRTPITR